MRTALTAAFILAIALSGFAQTSTVTRDDEAAIRRVLQQYDDTRTRGDWKTYGQLFIEDADQITSSNERRKGRAQIEKLTAELNAGVYKGGKYTSKVETVRLVAPNVAVADATFEISNIRGGSRRGHTTYVLVKSNDGWRIAATRSMVPTPVGATPSR